MFRYLQGVNIDTGAVDSYDYGPNHLIEEHIFVPNQRRGWLIGLFHGMETGTSRMAIFDAQNLSAGPRAIASLPYDLPPGLHGNFVSQA